MINEITLNSLHQTLKEFHPNFVIDGIENIGTETVTTISDIETFLNGVHPIGKGEAISLIGKGGNNKHCRYSHRGNNRH